MRKLPKVVPINELKNTEKISELCRESDIPIIVTRNGYGEMVLMSVALYETTMTDRREVRPAPTDELPKRESCEAPDESPKRESRAADDLTLLGQIFGD